MSSQPVNQVNQKQLQQVLNFTRNLPAAMAKKIIRQETRRAMKQVLLPPARSQTPKKTGALRKSIKIRAISRSRKSSGVRLASSDRDFVGDMFYAGFIEYGFTRGGTDVPGQEILRKIAIRLGPIAIDMAIQKIAQRVEQEWRKI